MPDEVSRTEGNPVLATCLIWQIPPDNRPPERTRPRLLPAQSHSMGSEGRWLRERRPMPTWLVRAGTSIVTRPARWFAQHLKDLLRPVRTVAALVQPDTLLRWHRSLFTLLWRRRSRRAGHLHG